MAKRAEAISPGVYTRLDGQWRTVAMVIDDGRTVVNYRDEAGSHIATIPAFRAWLRQPTNL